MSSVHVNIVNDFSVGALSHNAIQAPMPSPVINFSVEMIATQLWTLGYLMNQNKFAKKVLHKGMWIVQDGHDCGMAIPDVTFPIFPNLMYIVNWPFSSRKITFASHTVEVQKKPTACAQTFAFPPLPMMTCGDPVSAPTAFVMNNVMNNVKVGFTWTDFALGMLDIAISVAIDVVFECVGSKFEWKGAGELLENYSTMFSKGAKEALEEASEAGVETGAKQTWKAVGKEFAKKHVPIDLKSAAKRGATTLGGLATSSLKGNPTAKVPLGGPYLGAEGSYSSDKGLVGQGQVLGTQRDTTGGGADYGESL